jgi:hypothetical protein
MKLTTAHPSVPFRSSWQASGGATRVPDVSVPKQSGSTILTARDGVKSSTGTRSVDPASDVDPAAVWAGAPAEESSAARHKAAMTDVVGGRSGNPDMTASAGRCPCVVAFMVIKTATRAGDSQ